ncbi:sulfatase [Engelhardtia mirabilis]|uniref:Arylsulfatase n=1 Tax=Engelhardtia mirabilis TaxID=2528011 RepID=A0A518BL87_9BACT|nr:Arylsulfatase precursor [Planctomycetes bacterium Pla133]QDV02065.1 Arylsulfatase precursor [Planctomycetes bacterium Pla86]
MFEVSPRTRVRIDTQARAAWLLAAVLLAVGCGGGATSRERPNVLLISVDTLRADHLSLYGHDRATSPRIDAWAEGATVFERHFSASSWTAPSMAMLFTGRVRSDNSGKLWPDQPTLADVFDEAGYYTIGVSSNTLLADARGWGRSFDSYERYPIPERGPRNGWHSSEVVDRALAALDAAPEGVPVFLWVMPFDPHQPYLPSDPTTFSARNSTGRHDRFLRAMPAQARERLTPEMYRGIEAAIALYEGEIAQVDASIGRLFDELERRGRLERTVRVLTADHGEGLWQRAAPPDTVNKEKGAIPELYSTHGAMLEPEQIHVPLIISGPGVPAGVRRSEPTWSVDVMPTILGLAGLDAPPTDGVDLFADDAASRRTELVSFISRGGSILADGRYQLIVPTPKRAEKYGLTPVLYDLHEDPEARRPIDDPELAAELEARLQVWWDSRRHEGEDELDDEDRAVLEALGYTDGEADQER